MTGMELHENLGELRLVAHQQKMNFRLFKVLNGHVSLPFLLPRLLQQPACLFKTLFFILAGPARACFRSGSYLLRRCCCCRRRRRSPGELRGWAGGGRGGGVLVAE